MPTAYPETGPTPPLLVAQSSEAFSMFLTITFLVFSVAVLREVVLNRASPRWLLIPAILWAILILSHVNIRRYPFLMFLQSDTGNITLVFLSLGLYAAMLILIVFKGRIPYAWALLPSLCLAMLGAGCAGCQCDLDAASTTDAIYKFPANIAELRAQGSLFAIGLTAGAFPCLIAIARRNRHVRRQNQRSQCSKCGYNLKGLIEPRCPECGQPFDQQREPPS